MCTLRADAACSLVSLVAFRVEYGAMTACGTSDLMGGRLLVYQIRLSDEQVVGNVEMVMMEKEGEEGENTTMLAQAGP